MILFEHGRAHEQLHKVMDFPAFTGSWPPPKSTWRNPIWEPDLIPPWHQCWISQMLLWFNVSQSQLHPPSALENQSLPTHHYWGPSAGKTALDLKTLQTGNAARFISWWSARTVLFGLNATDDLFKWNKIPALQICSTLTLVLIFFLNTPESKYVYFLKRRLLWSWLNCSLLNG